MKKLILLIALNSCTWVPAALQDNPFEEYTEDSIRDHTGIRIDFTGLSPDKDK